MSYPPVSSYAHSVYVWGIIYFARVIIVLQLLSCVWVFMTHGLQHARLPCPLLSPRACSNSCPLSWQCHPTILFFVTPLLLLPSIFPSIRDFSSELSICIRWPKYWSFSISPFRRGSLREYHWHIYLAMCKINNQWKAAVLTQGAQLGALWQPRGVEWRGRRELHEGGDICVLVADSHGCVAEANAIL